MSVKDVTVRLFADSKDAQAKLDGIYLKAEELGKLNPEIKVRIDKAAQSQAFSVLRQSLRDADKDAEKLGGDLENVGKSGASASPGVASMVTPMVALVGAGVALSPILLTVGVGLAGFGAAAFSAVDPVLKAAQATGGLQANMASLNPEQQQLAKGVLSLKGDFDQFSKALQPEVFSVFNAGLGIAKTLLHDVEPVAAATGKAFATVASEIGKGLQDQEWRQFFAFMAQNAGPDVLLLGKALGALADALPPLLEDLQPVATDLLTLTAGAAKAAQGVALLAQKIQATENTSKGQNTNNWLQGILHFAEGPEQLITVPFDHLKNAVNGTSDAAKKIAPAADKAGTSIKSMGSSAQTTAQQATTLYNALHKLLDPLTANINDAVTFRDDQVTLTAALKKSSDQTGLHTAAQRASATAMSQAAQDALTLSQNIFTQTGSARKALGPLQQLASQLQNSGAKGAYARDILRELKAAEDALYNKKVTIAYDIQTFGQAPGGGGHILSAPGSASGGLVPGGLRLVGEQGPELVSLPASSYVYNHQQTTHMLGAGAGGGTPTIVLDFQGVDQALATALKQIIRVRGGDPNVIGR